MKKAPRDRTHEPKAHEAYMTIDPRPIPALLKHVTLRGQVWECAAGTGEMAARLAVAGYAVFPTDIQQFGWTCGPIDFLACEEVPDRALQSIVTNPPNKLNFDFAMKALQLTERVQGMVCLYQRDEWDTTQRTAPIFDHPAFAMKIVCRFRPRWFAKRPDKSNSPFHRFSWYIWDWKWDGAPIIRFA